MNSKNQAKTSSYRSDSGIAAAVNRPAAAPQQRRAPQGKLAIIGSSRETPVPLHFTSAPLHNIPTHNSTSPQPPPQPNPSPTPKLTPSRPTQTQALQQFHALYCQPCSYAFTNATCSASANATLTRTPTSWHPGPCFARTPFPVGFASPLVSPAPLRLPGGGTFACAPRFRVPPRQPLTAGGRAQTAFGGRISTTQVTRALQAGTRCAANDQANRELSHCASEGRRGAKGVVKWAGVANITAGAAEWYRMAVDSGGYRVWLKQAGTGYAVDRQRPAGNALCHLTCTQTHASRHNAPAFNIIRVIKHSPKRQGLVSDERSIMLTAPSSTLLQRGCMARAPAWATAGAEGEVRQARKRAHTKRACLMCARA